MSDDLVEQLRLIGTRVGVTNRMRDAVAGREAADRIEHLEAALREIATRCDAHRLPGCDRNGQWAADTARKALEEKDD